MAQNLRNRLKLSSGGSSNNLSTTPVKPNLNNDRDYSPVYLPCTQETLENVEVLWDWNSPQSKHNANRRPKRILSHQKSSPKLLIQKLAKNKNSHKTFDKIRDELLAFREDITSRESPILDLNDADLDFDTSFNNNELDVKTEIDEDTFPTASNYNINTNTFTTKQKPVITEENPNNKHDLSDLFDDSLEQELILVSQQVEEKFKKSEMNQDYGYKPFIMSSTSTNTSNIKQETPAKSEKIKMQSPRTLTKSFSSNTLFDSPIRTPHRSKFDFKGKLQQLKMNDSFDVALEAFDEDEIFDNFDSNSLGTKNSTVTSNLIQNNNTNSTFPKNETFSDDFRGGAAGSVIPTSTQFPDLKESPLKFKTKSLSFGHSYLKKTNEEVMREEIEKKRLAALAKLRAKKAQTVTTSLQMSQGLSLPTGLSDSDTSPIKCSPEEIELKRKLALAKLEQKKQQDLIERNRLEALKKLEMKRRNRKP